MIPAFLRYILISLINISNGKRNKNVQKDKFLLSSKIFLIQKEYFIKKISFNELSVTI